MKSQNKNFLFNIAYQLLTFIIPIILTPYVSRVLGVENIGIYSYTHSIVYYFMLLTMLGINNYGTREIAKCKTIEDRSRTFKSIHRLQLFCGGISLLSYMLLLLLSSYEHKDIMIIDTIFLLSALLDINWFYFGIEKFKLTTTRNAIIKLLSVVLVFSLVKNSDQLWLYTTILSSTTVLSQLFLWTRIKKEIIKVKVSIKDIAKHIKPCLILFIPVISYSIYRVMDKTMIGAIAKETELGNYESAEKIISIPISFITALGTVMLPHMSKKDKSDIEKNIYSTFELTMFFTVASVIGLAIIAPEFTKIFFGNGFDKTALIIQLISSTILFTGIASVIRTNYLIPLGKDKIYITSTIIGAVLNLICNIMFIPLFGSYGACIGTILAEFVLMLYQIIKTKDSINFKKVLRLFVKYAISGVIMAAAMLLISIPISNSTIRLLAQIITGIIVYGLLNRKFLIYDFLGKKQKRIS